MLIKQVEENLNTILISDDATEDIIKEKEAEIQKNHQLLLY